jgi:hypothetical protein
MTRGDRNFLHASLALTTVTGGIFAWMKYAMTSDDPFAVANHPWQPYMLDTHVVLAPFLLFALGLIFRSHIWRKYRGRKPHRRWSGIGAMSLIVPMVLSGYLLQTGTNETFRKAMAVTHWIASGLFVASYLLHQFSRRNGAAPSRPHD